MRVLVNAVAARRGGGASHLGPFLADLGQAMAGSFIDVYVTADAPEFVCGSNVKRVIVKVPQGINFRRLLWDNVSVLRLSRTYDVVVSPLNFGPLYCSKPHILFQRNALYFDPLYVAKQRPLHRIKLLGYRWLAVRQSNSADAVVVPTTAMAELIASRIKEPGKVHVLPHTINIERARDLARRNPPPEADLWLNYPIRLLNVGTPASHKGLVTLAKIFSTLRSTLGEHAVALAVTFAHKDDSPSVRAFINQLDAGDLQHVVWLGKVNHEQVFPLYRSASVLLLPTEVESFCFPVLEALVVGCPVVATDLPAIREISRSSAHVFPVSDASEAVRLVQVVLECKDGEVIYGDNVVGNEQSQGRAVARLIADLAGNALTNNRNTI